MKEHSKRFMDGMGNRFRKLERSILEKTVGYSLTFDSFSEKVSRDNITMVTASIDLLPYYGEPSWDSGANLANAWRVPEIKGRTIRSVFNGNNEEGRDLWYVEYFGGFNEQYYPEERFQEILFRAVVANELRLREITQNNPELSTVLLDHHGSEVIEDDRIVIREAVAKGLIDPLVFRRG